MAALANGYAARWMLPLGILLAAGAAGLLAGVLIPVLGAAAATGLVVYSSAHSLHTCARTIGASAVRWASSCRPAPLVMDDRQWPAERFGEHRSHLRAVAYQMLGSVSEADDALQDARLRTCDRHPEQIRNIPVVSFGDGADPAQEAILADSVGLALLVVLDALTPPSGSRSCSTTCSASRLRRSRRRSTARRRPR